MTQTQMVNQLKFRITSLQSQLHDKQKQLEQYQTIESQADSKIKAMNKVHADKVRNLLNSIQILKKQKASIQGLSKEHKRSKLIQQLNKQIADQDLAIQVLRKFIYDEKGKQKGREVCDEIIIKALTKGPERIRPLSREQLRMEIDRYKSINLALEGKLKNRANDTSGRLGRNNEADNISEVSTVSEESFVNQNQNILRRMRDLQFQNQNTKLQINAKLKIIQQLKLELKEKDKLKTDLQISRNETEIATRKAQTLEKLIKQTKQNTNTKIIELYEREIKVEELQMVSKENRDKLKEAQQNHNILTQEMRLQKQQVEAELQALKSQNQQLILENIASKKRLDQLKKIIKDMDQINSKQKQDLKGKVSTFQKELQKLIKENTKYTEAYKNIENTLFQERAEWVDQKSKLIEELTHSRENAASKELIGKYMQDIADLKQENSKLKQLLEGGGTGGDDHLLLERLDNYKRKLEFYEGKGDKSKEKEYYDEIFKKYNDLAQQFEDYKRKYGPKKKIGQKRKHFIEVNPKEQSQYEHMSSGISKLGLEQIDSDILDNFDSSYEFEIVLNEFGEKVRMPKLTDGDRQLLKLITSDLWGFVADQKMDKKIQEAASFYVDDNQPSQPIDYVKVRQIKNLANPRAKKIVIYQEQMDKLDKISDSVSVTSALDKELNKYDSDVNIEMQKMPKGAPRDTNSYGLNDMTYSVDGLSSVSSVKSGQSNLGKKKKKAEDKGSRISIQKNNDKSLSDIGDSSIGSSLLDSDVSSNGIRESQLNGMDSDVEINFKKKKK